MLIILQTFYYQFLRLLLFLFIPSDATRRRIPEINMSRNSVQVHQLLQEINSAAAISVPHVQGQRGSIIAANINSTKIRTKSEKMNKRLEGLCL